MGLSRPGPFPLFSVVWGSSGMGGLGEEAQSVETRDPSVVKTRDSKVPWSRASSEYLKMRDSKVPGDACLQVLAML